MDLFCNPASCRNQDPEILILLDFLSTNHFLTLNWLTDSEACQPMASASGAYADEIQNNMFRLLMKKAFMEGIGDKRLTSLCLVIIRYSAPLSCLLCPRGSNLYRGQDFILHPLGMILPLMKIFMPPAKKRNLPLMKKMLGTPLD